MKKFNDLNKNYQELVLTIISDLKEESIIKLYDSIANLIDYMEEDGIAILKILPRSKPMCNVQTLFDLFREYGTSLYELQESYIEIRKYIGMEINIFILVNIMDSK